MSLSSMLAQREAEHRPVRVGLIGAGKFGSMYLSQALRTPGIHIVGVTDRDIDRAKTAFERVGWPRERYAAASPGEALADRTTVIIEDAAALIECSGVDLIIEATGSPSA